MTESANSLPLREPRQTANVLSVVQNPALDIHPRVANSAAATLSSSPGFDDFTEHRPARMGQGMLKTIYQLQQSVCVLSGSAEASLVALSVRQAEFAALSVIVKYHQRQRQPRQQILLCDDLPILIEQAAKMGLESKVVSESALLEQLSAQVAAVVVAASVFTRQAWPEPLVAALKERDILLYLSGAGRHSVADERHIQADLATLDLSRLCEVDQACLAVLAKEAVKPFLPVPRVVLNDAGTYEWQTLQQNPFSIGRLNGGAGNVPAMLQCMVKIELLGLGALQLQAQKAVASAWYLTSRIMGSRFVVDAAIQKTALAAGCLQLLMEFSEEAVEATKKCLGTALDKGVVVESHFTGHSTQFELVISRVHYLSKAQLDVLASDIQRLLIPFTITQE